MLAWAAFALLLGGALSVRLLFGAGLIAMTVYLTGLALEWRGAFWGATFEGIETFIPVAAAIYALPSLLPAGSSAPLAGVHRIVGAGIGLLGILLVSLRGVLHLPGFEGREVEGIGQLVGLITSVAVVAQPAGLNGRPHWYVASTPM